MTDPILEEVYAARKRLWDLGGGTIAGVCAYLRAHPISGVKTMPLPVRRPAELVKPRRASRARPPRASTRKKAPPRP